MHNGPKDPVSKRRDKLIDFVYRGKLSPSQAEQCAENCQLGPLAPQPPDMDPMLQKYWNLPMAGAWIVWGNRAAVREAWPEYRSYWFEWRRRTPRHAGLGAPDLEERSRDWILEPVRTIGLLNLKTLTVKSPRCDYDEGWTALKKALEDGDLSSRAYCGPGPSERRIEPQEWAPVYIHREGDPEPLQSKDKGRSEKLQSESEYDPETLQSKKELYPFEFAAVRSEDVLRIWPARTDGKAHEDVRRYLVRFFRKYPVPGPYDSKAKVQADVCLEFGIAGRQFEKPWNNAIDETGAEAWRQPGRRPGTMNGPK